MSLLCQLAHHFEAGKELDDLIALHVMKWVMISGGERNDTWARLVLEGNLRDHVMKISEWRPSIAIFQALQVLDACGAGLTKDGKGLTWGTAIRRTGHDHWEVSLCEDMMGTTQSVWAPTLPLAISRAALVWAMRADIDEEGLDQQRLAMMRQSGPIAGPQIQKP